MKRRNLWVWMGIGLLSIGIPTGLVYGEPKTSGEKPAAAVPPPNADPWSYKGGTFVSLERGFWGTLPEGSGKREAEYGTWGGLAAGYQFPSDCLPEFRLCLDGQVLGRVAMIGWLSQWRASIESRVAFFFQDQHRVGLLLGFGVGVGSQLTDGLSSSLAPTATQINLQLGTSLGMVVRATQLIDFTFVGEMWNPVLPVFIPTRSERSQYGFTFGTQFRL